MSREEIKALLNISNGTDLEKTIDEIVTLIAYQLHIEEENIVTVYINVHQAFNAILNYVQCNEWNNEWNSLLISLAKSYMCTDSITDKNLIGERITTQETQGSRSVSFQSIKTTIAEDGLTDIVRNSLPYPRIKVM